jgi:hypothetical protein
VAVEVLGRAGSEKGPFEPKYGRVVELFQGRLIDDAKKGKFHIEMGRLPRWKGRSFLVNVE